MILLDTHAVVWLASDPDRLSAPARAALSAEKTALCVSVISAWEIALLVKRERLRLPLGPAEYMARAIAHAGLVELDITRSVALAAVALPEIHRDPFDRILVAECLQRGMTLISCDEVIPKYPGVRVIW